MLVGGEGAGNHHASHMEGEGGGEHIRQQAARAADEEKAVPLLQILRLRCIRRSVAQSLRGSEPVKYGEPMACFLFETLFYTGEAPQRPSHPWRVPSVRTCFCKTVNFDPDQRMKTDSMEGTKGKGAHDQGIAARTAAFAPVCPSVLLHPLSTDLLGATAYQGGRHGAVPKNFAVETAKRPRATIYTAEKQSSCSAKKETRFAAPQ